MKNILRIGSVSLALLALLAAGCADGTAKQDGTQPLTVGFIYVGPRDDYGYNQAHAEGAAAVRKLPGVRVTEEERVADTVEVQKTMKSMIAQDGAKIIFPTSFNYFDPHTLKIAREYPDVSFVHCGGLYLEGEHPTNVYTYFGYIDECQYLSGIVAGHVTKTNKLAFVAGKPIPQVLRNVNAFTLGARSVDPAITCSVIFTGDWTQPIKEAEAASSLIDQGVDVMTCHVNSPKVVTETAEKRNVMTCGYHASQAPLAPKGYLTGAEWNWEKIYTEYILAFQAGKPMPHMIRGGLKEQVVRTSPYGPLVAAAAKRDADAAKAKLVEGSFAIFKGPLKSNAGKLVIAEGVALAQSAVELEKMDYLVEGVVGQ